MNQDRRLERALERAVRVPPPPGLLRRLLAIPARDRPSRATWRWVAAPAAVAAVAVLAFALIRNEQAPAPGADDTLAAEAAVRDFTIAMAYLQKSAEIASRHIDGEIGDGMAQALTLSRGAFESNTSNGG